MSVRTYIALTLALFSTAILATATTLRANEGNGCCGEPSCNALNNPLVACVTGQDICGANPDGYYYFCCDVGPTGCPV